MLLFFDEVLIPDTTEDELALQFKALNVYDVFLLNNGAEAVTDAGIGLAMVSRLIACELSTNVAVVVYVG